MSDPWPAGAAGSAGSASRLQGSPGWTRWDARTGLAARLLSPQWFFRTVRPRRCCYSHCPMKETMKLIPLMTVAAAVAVFPNVAGAQTTNFVPLTRLEAFEMVTGRVIIKGTEEIGSVVGKNGLVTVKCEELRDVASNQREFGLVIQVQQNENLQETTTVD